MAIPFRGIKSPQIILAPQQIVFYAKMAARIISESRGGKDLIYRGFKYQKNRERGEIMHWRCWKEEYRAPLKINTFDLEDENARIIVQNEPQHTKKIPLLKNRK